MNQPDLTDTFEKDRNQSSPIILVGVIAVNVLKTGSHKVMTVTILKWHHVFFNAIMCQEDADGMANSVDLDQTALGAF